MKRAITKLFVAIVLPISGSLSAVESEVDFVSDFYRKYINEKMFMGQTVSVDRLPLTAGLTRLWKLNLELCGKVSKKGEIVCGIGNDGDVFLNSQEIDPELNFDKAAVNVRAIKNKGLVEVSLNVFPSLGEAYRRKLQFVLKKENDQIRIDNVLLVQRNEVRSLRKLIESEK